MFSLQIVDTDAFLDMPATSQLLYFHLSMRADDDGFVPNPKKIMRMINSQEDDLKVLMVKRFILSFESGVIVIKHWRINNYIQKDRYQETKYLDEKNGLAIKDNGAYTECLHDVSKSDTQVRLGEVRLGEEREERDVPDKPERHISYLSNIPEEDLKGFVYRFDATEKQIKGKAEELMNYCRSHGKKYKDYNAFLLNALKRDFKEMTEEERERRRVLKERLDATVNPEAKSAEQIKVDEMRSSLANKMKIGSSRV